ncbi:MAG: hypothetical protein JXL85_02345 [Bacilli bacterium]|nr:hypothetical protein [Bacilli bacterium]
MLMFLAMFGNVYTEHYMYDLGYTFNEIFIWNNISFIFVSATLICAFFIAIKNRAGKKSFSLQFLWISLIMVFFLSYYYFIITYFVGGILGLSNSGYNTMFSILFWVQQGMRLLIMLIQINIVLKMEKSSYFIKKPLEEKNTSWLDKRIQDQ